MDLCVFKYLCIFGLQSFNSATERLTLTNKARNKLQAEIKLFESRIKDREQVIRQKDKAIDEFKEEIDRLETKIAYNEQQKNDLQGMLNTVEHHFDQTQKEYEERINNINEIANQNRKKKEIWASNFEKEQKAHTATMEELVKTQSKLKEVENSLSNLKISTKALK